MDRHLYDIELIELAGGHLEASAREAARNHLATCADCDKRYHAVAQTWRMLGHWETPADAEVIQPVLATRWSWQPAMRLAAMLMLAAGVGIASGWLLGRDGAEASETAWDIWRQSTPAGLAEPMLSLLQIEDEESPL